MKIQIMRHYEVWEPWFAWWPVCVRHAYEVRCGTRIYDRWEWVWLVPVERQLINIPHMTRYNYRERSK